ncbi:GGDEF domain-containing protein [Saccharospirillum salsuginis]|uniref:diguanylate cyclase n=1 Tax=Saccharospirillum salsuginis TaxID=418750 RepID=A0A918K4Z8_9GAMM|nr:GGDEF domain-containing protein [Saccharospirillum salsuginis]GGX48212.1 hypothetical protein GCM10007392_13890 [Saccharospirillum salsuginis]
MNEIQEWLRRGVLDLSIMLRGIDADLDTGLESLKQTLRERESMDVDAFRQALEHTDDCFDRIENVAERGTQQLYLLYRDLLKLADSAPADLRQEVESQSQYLFDALGLLENVRHVLPSELPSDLPNDGDDDSTLIRLRQKLCSRFITLLRTLAILGDEDGALRSLASRLEPLPDWSTLDHLAAETISLIQQRLDAEKGQFEHYLNELNSKLERINALISEGGQSMSALNELNEDLGRNVDAQLNRARQEISDASNLEQLRESLNHSLDGLLTLLNDFQSRTGKSLQDMTQRQDELNEQLQALQEDNHRLIQQVTHERELSMRDPLTQLPNRHGFELRLRDEMARNSRYGHPVSLALIDVDHFKRINDQFGHLAGDKVLKILAKQMDDQIRETDYLARFGGEEFILLLPQTAQEDAFVAVEKVRQHISECPFNFQGKPVQITVSMGVTEYQTDEGLETWMHRADEALYRSKDEGRNRTTLAQITPTDTARDVTTNSSD